MPAHGFPLKGERLTFVFVNAADWSRIARATCTGLEPLLLFMKTSHSERVIWYVMC
jgi:hypothetical protein